MEYKKYWIILTLGLMLTSHVNIFSAAEKKPTSVNQSKSLMLPIALGASLISTSLVAYDLLCQDLFKDKDWERFLYAAWGSSLTAMLLARIESNNLIEEEGIEENI